MSVMFAIVAAVLGVWVGYGRGVKVGRRQQCERWHQTQQAPLARIDGTED